MQVIIAFATHYKKNGRRKQRTSQLDLSNWMPTSMLRMGAEALCEKSNVEAIPASLIYNVGRALPWFSPRSVALLNRSSTEMREVDVAHLLQSIQEDCRARPETSRDRAYVLAAAIRTVLECGPDTLGDGTSLSAAIERSRAHLRQPNRPLSKPLLPDEIALQSHVDWDDLRQQTYNKLQKRRAEIEDAASKEFDRYEKLVKNQAEWLTLQVPAKSRSAVEMWLDSDREPRDRDNLDLIPLQEIAAVMLQRQAQEAAPLDANGWPRWDHAVPEIMSSLDEFKAYRYKMSSAPWSHARHRLPNPVLTVIFLVILNHTGWNQGAVGELTVNRLAPIPQGGYRIQGYKGKTDDDTPVVDVPMSARLTCKAIGLLLWNHQRLQQLGLIKSSEQRVWFGWQRDGFETISDILGWSRVKSFCERHGIETFTPSELRPLAAAVAYLPQRDLEAVRILLGHKDLRVSDAYLRDTLFFRMNEANMLQFQRRIETSLVFSAGGIEQVKLCRLSPRDIDPTLLVPTGDGGTCTAPFDGHQSQRLEAGEPCSGLLCHQDGGCSNYRLQVDEKTIEMALRTRLYYQSRWSELTQKNLIAFTRIHLPRLLFIHVLLSVIHSRRPDLLQQAKKNLT